MASEALRMVINLEVDQTLQSNYHNYQRPRPQHTADTNTSNDNDDKQHIFPQQIKMFPWNDIQQITQYIFEQTDIATEHQRLFFRGREITAYHRRKSMKSNRSTPRNSSTPKPTTTKRKKLSSPTLAFFGITHQSTIYLQCKSANDELPIVPYGHCSVLLPQIKSSSNNNKLIEQCINGLYDDMRPILSTDGEGGTYFLRNSNNQKIACFKPSDEEAGCINNPRGRTDPQQAMHCGIKPSEGHLREIAAYLIDNNQSNQKFARFHNVPPTMRVEIAYNGFHYNSAQKTLSPEPTCIDYEAPTPKIGALQKFIKGEVIENFGVKNFAIRQVHKIGILDIRILNCDRNSGNVLVSKDEFNGRYELIPIDHGLSMPEKIEITRDSWVWLNWDQSKQPFDPYTIEYINNIDIEKDIKQLKSELNFSEITFENMRISNLVLKKGANKGLTLHEIGSIIARPDFDTKSILEELMTQAEILAIEKFRQSKHLHNRIKLKRRKSIENTNKSDAVEQKHIVQKFIEKGIPLKTPILPRHTVNTMCYVPSLAPGKNVKGGGNGNGSKGYQVLNTGVSQNGMSGVNGNGNRNKMIFPGSPVIPLSSTGSMKMSISPNPGKLNVSTSLGSGALSFTPEPFVLYNSNGNVKPKGLVILKTESNASAASTDGDMVDNEKTFEIPFWTPNYRALSSMSQQSSNPNMPRSVTPDRGGLRNKKSPQLPPFYLETPPKPLMKVRQSTDTQDELKVDVNINGDEDEEDEDVSGQKHIYSPLQIQFLEKTSSIHDRDGNTILSEQDGKDHANAPGMNPIFKSISVASQESDGDDEREQIEQIDPDILFNKISIQPQLDINNDDDESEEVIKESFVKSPIETMKTMKISEIEDDYDKLYDSKPQPFSSLTIDTTVDTTNSQKNSSDGGTAEMVPLSRSTSCIDVRKTDARKSSTFSLNALDSGKNLMGSTSNQSSNPLNGMNVSMDDDSIFLYHSDEIKSASLINHSSMLEKRKEMMALQNDDSNSSGGNNMDNIGGAVTSRSYSEISAPPSILTSIVLEQQNNKIAIDSPSNSNHILNITTNNGNSNHSVHTPSNTSQDDMIRKKDHEFVIHPIMERMAKENQEVKKWFMYYLDQLLGIQCERILNRSRKNDNRDNIYDIDTVHGSFIWKNELRKHWIRSRLERKRLMQQLPPKNPFVDSIQFINKDEQKKETKNIKKKKPKLMNAKTNPVRSKPLSQNPWINDEEEDEDEIIDVQQAETSNYIDLNNLSDDEEQADWFGIEQHAVDSDDDED